VIERVCLRWSSKHFWQKNLVKKSDDLHPRQGNLLQRNIFTGLNKTSLYNTKYVGLRQAEICLPFFNMLPLVLRFLWAKAGKVEKSYATTKSGQIMVKKVEKKKKLAK
jgi:hypothetical protein